MVKILTAVSFAAGVLVLVSQTAQSATPGEHPYAVINQQNIFHLNPAPQPAPPETAPPPDIKITGIIKTGSDLKALFAIPPKEAKDPVTYVCLSEGQEEAGVALIKIFSEREECEVINSGIKMTVSFKNNSYAAVHSKTPSLNSNSK